MNCETCESQLLSLVYGELETAEANEARSHMQACASCSKSYEKLGAARRIALQLRHEEPASELDDRILEAARAQAARAARKARVEHEDAPGVWQSMMAWLGKFALGPQVAMATVLMLVVGIGLIYLPSLREQHASEVGPVVSPEASGEAAPSQPLAPAEPMDFDEWRRTHEPQRPEPPRDRNTDGLALEVEHNEGVADQGQQERPADVREPARANAPVATATRAAEDPRASGRVVTARLDDGEESPAADVQIPSGQSLRQLNEAESVRRPATRSPALGTATGGEGGRTAGASRDETLAVAREQQAQRARFEPGAGMESDSRPSRQPATSSPVAMAPAAPPPAQMPAPTQAPAEHRMTASSGGAGNTSTPGAASSSATASPRALYDRGMARYRGRDYRGAATDLDTVVRRQSPTEVLPSALHHLARSYRASGQCGAAVNQYSALLRRFPTYPATSDAIFEAADCYRRLGRTAEARLLLQRVERVASLRDRARREMIRLDETDRARTAPAAAESAAPASTQ